MKKYRSVLLLFVTALTLSFISGKDYKLATAESINGFRIFFLSKPQTKYQVLGEIKIDISFSGELLTGKIITEQLFKEVISKAKKEYPNADGILFTGFEIEKAKAIKFIK